MAFPAESMHHHDVGEGLVPSRGDNANIVLGNPGRHKTLPYTNMRIYRVFLPPNSVPAGLRFC